MRNKKERGITLVALVITIIVLLILAGVAINMAINSDGLFGKANEAVESWNTAVEEEKTVIQELLNELGISAGGDTSTLPEGWDANKIASTVTETSTITGIEKERIVPIPKGFVASQIGGTTPENTIAGGLVIYQIPEGATVDWEASTITIGEATTNLQETVNQYVWIPVDDINKMVMCKSNNSTGTVTEENTSDVCNVKLVNGILQCTNTAHTANATNLCGRLYGTATNALTKPYSTSMNFADRTQTWTDNTGYREPDIVNRRDTDDTTGGLTAFTSQITNDFINMATSAAKYGGFYISRYEAGVNGASLKNQVVITAASSTATSTVYAGVDDWYGLYNSVHNEISVGTSKIQSHMIYGSQYDQIINFLESNSNNEPQKGYTARQLTTKGLTGANSADVMNNIYDLEGNNCEWTVQANSTDLRVFRGSESFYANSGNFYPSSYRNKAYPTETWEGYATRLSLYL